MLNSSFNINKTLGNLYYRFIPSLNLGVRMNAILPRHGGKSGSFVAD
jgi:hypothetical protein